MSNSNVFATILAHVYVRELWGFVRSEMCCIRGRRKVLVSPAILLGKCDGGGVNGGVEVMSMSSITFTPTSTYK